MKNKKTIAVHTMRLENPIRFSSDILHESISSIEDVLISTIKKGAYGSAATCYVKDKKYQCSIGRYRSAVDVAWLVNSYFPNQNISIKSIRNIMYIARDKGLCSVSVCPTIGRVKWNSASVLLSKAVLKEILNMLSIKQSA